MSVSWGTQYTKLKTNLRLAANRLKLLQKKKTEQAIKARGEIADFLNSDKEDRARIRVENIIREDFVVEAYELLEMYCELLLARFGIIQQMKDLDDGIAEAVSSLLWVAPRIGHEITEFKAINDELTHKYGKQFAEAARMNQLPEPSRVSTKLVQKLSVSAPNKLLVEKYLITIAQSGNIPFTPDPKVMRDDDDEIARAERNLINFMNEEQYGWSVKSDDANSVQGGPTNVGNTFNGGGGRGGFPQATQGPPPEYAPPPPPPNYISPQQQGPGANSNVYPTQNQNTAMPYISSHGQTNFGVQPMPNALPEKQSIDQHIYETPPPMHQPHPTQPGSESDNEFLLPKFPDPPKEVPNTLGRGGGSGFPRTGGDDGPNMMGNGNQNADLDFDALARRFEELKKKL